MRAAIYARVSTDEQALKGTSIQDQVERCTNKAREMGAEEVVSFVDEGYSGDDPTRPGMQNLLQAVKEGQFDLVVCLDVDRWARDLADQLAFADEVEKHARLEFVTHSRGDPNNPEDTLFFQMKGAFAQYEKAKIRQRTYGGAIRKAKQGKIVKPGGFPGHPGPYGYSYNGDKENPQLIIKEDEAKIVRQIFEWVAYEGLGMGSVLIRLNENKIPSPMGKTWQISSVRRLLHNEVYTGVFYNFKYKTQVTNRGSKKRIYKKVPVEQRYPVEIPAIVSRELWELANAKIKENGLKTRIGRKYNYLLAGHITCGVCGRKYYTCSQYNGPYYRCAGSHRIVTLNTCKAPILPAKTNSTTMGLDDLVWSAITDRLKKPDLILKELQRQQKTGEIAASVAEIETKMAAQKKNLYDLDKQKEELLDLRLEGLISSDDLHKRLSKLQKYKDNLTREINNLDYRLKALKRQTQLPTDVKTFCERFAKMLDVLRFEEKKEIIRLLDIRVTVYKDKRIVIEWPFKADTQEIIAELKIERYYNKEKYWPKGVHLDLPGAYTDLFEKKMKEKGISGSELIRNALREFIFDDNWVKTLKRLIYPRENNYKRGAHVTKEMYDRIKYVQEISGVSEMQVVRKAVIDYLNRNTGKPL
ncbi:MAG: site-specific recombinase [Moorella sp. (in: firmicutes)]|nr:site-specific recombinase [Moorella sp. (in: firmicutes)]